MSAGIVARTVKGLVGRDDGVASGDAVAATFEGLVESGGYGAGVGEAVVYDASSAMAHQAATVIVEDLDKVWNTVGDNKVRESHVSANGQRRATAHPYNVCRTGERREG